MQANNDLSMPGVGTRLQLWFTSERSLEHVAPSTDASKLCFCLRLLGPQDEDMSKTKNMNLLCP